MEYLRVRENTTAENWPTGRKPEWLDERTRLYTGFRVTACGRDWAEILTAYDGEVTTAYLTQYGFRLDAHGPAIHRIRGKVACHRRVIREWFRDYCGGKEVRFT